MEKRKIELKRQQIFLLLQEINETEPFDPINYCPKLKYRECEPGSPWRMNRLNQIIGCLYVVKPNIIKKLVSLEDNEGILTTIWKERPSDYEKTIVNFMWEISDGTGNNTEHFMNVLELA